MEKYAIVNKAIDLKMVVFFKQSNESQWFYIEPLDKCYKETNEGMKKVTRDLFLKTLSTHLIIEHGFSGEMPFDELIAKWIHSAFGQNIEDEQWETEKMIMDKPRFVAFAHKDSSFADIPNNDDYKEFVLAEDLPYRRDNTIEGVFIDDDHLRLDGNETVVFHHSSVKTVMKLLEQTKTEKKAGLNYIIKINPTGTRPLAVQLIGMDYFFLIAPCQPDIEEPIEDDDDDDFEEE